MSRPPLLSPTIPPKIGAALAVLALGLLAPGSARAGCVHGAPGGAFGSDHFELLRASGAIQAVEIPQADHPQDRPRPCSGPSCSRRTDLPPTPPTGFGLSRATQWAMVLPTVPPASPGALRCHGEEPITRPMSAPGSIFHPPRRDA